MKQYIREREKQQKFSNITGIGLTIGLHLLLCLLGTFSGFKYIYPPPQETSFLIDFTEEEEITINHMYGDQPRAEEVDRTRPIELVQQSESPYVANVETNETPASAADDFGDVEVPEIEQEPVLDPRASFPGMSKKDTSLTAPHSAREASDSFKAGQPDGNTDYGRTEGAPNAHLKGRKVLGTIPRPTYSVQESGVVVVSVWVDQYGQVTRALPGADGTTVTDKTLWAAARKAAMETHFNQSADAPALQQGTITYIFKLK